MARARATVSNPVTALRALVAPAWNGFGSSSNLRLVLKFHSEEVMQNECLEPIPPPAHRARLVPYGEALVGFKAKFCSLK